MSTAQQNESQLLRRAETKRQKLLNNLMNAFVQLDADQSGVITRDESAPHLGGNEEVSVVFKVRSTFCQYVATRGEPVNSGAICFSRVSICKRRGTMKA